MKKKFLFFVLFFALFSSLFMLSSCAKENKNFEGLSFEDKSVMYDGQAHSLEVTGVPEFAEVKYTENLFKDVGEYEITATVSAEGYNDWVKKAKLTILMPADESGVVYFLNYEKNGYVVGGYIGQSPTVNIMSSFNGKPVTGIRSGAFYNNEFVEDIFVPGSINIIERTTFSGCNNLKSVKFGEGLKEIKENAFSSCHNLKNISLPNSIEHLEEDAFYNCENLELHEFEQAGYLGNSENPLLVLFDIVDKSITSFSIPNETEIINARAFENCDLLKSITFSDGVRSICENAFSGCESLEYVNIQDLSSWASISFYDGLSNPIYITKEFYVDEKLVTDLVIPDGVEEIKNFAFAGCNKLKTLTIPSSVKSIASSAFRNCTELTGIYIENMANWVSMSFIAYSSPLYYAKYLYLNNQLVTDLVIPEGVTKIGDYVFEGCDYINSVTIPSSVKEIGNAFFDCSNLSAVYINNIKSWVDISFFSSYCNPLYHAKNLYLNGELLTDLVIPEGVTEIKTNTFFSCESITSVSIPKSLEKIGSFAFNQCRNIDKVYINDLAAWLKVFIPDDYANPMHFSADLYLKGELLTDLIIPEGVSVIASNMFTGCKSIKSLTIPSSLKEIGNMAFYQCPNLKIIKINDLSAWMEIDFHGYTSLDTFHDLYLNEKLITNLVIPQGTKKIAANAFRGCQSITSVTLPAGIELIGNMAFNNCKNLNAVYIDDLPSWFNIYFSSKESNPLFYAKNLYLNNNLITDLVIPKEVTKLKDYVFAGSNVRSIKITSNVKEIATSAFANYDQLEDLIIEDIAAWVSIDFENSEANPFLAAQNVYIGDKSIVDVVIPEGVERIESYAFAYFKNMRSIVLPKSIRYIGSFVFNYCRNLTGVFFDGKANEFYQTIIEDFLIKDKIYYRSDIEPPLNSSGTDYNGKYWHYVDGVPTIWVK